MAYNLYGCWVSEYQPTPDVDSTENTILIEHIKLECESWERVANIQEKTEPDL